MSKEIQHVTWNLAGAQLSGAQSANRLYYAGFKDAKLCTEMAATLKGESDWYLEAWHHNVDRDSAGNIQRDSDGMIVIESTDLGFIQENVVHPDPVHLADADCESFAMELFKDMPEKADGAKSAQKAWELYKARGFQPWYAHTNGSYKQHLPVAGLAVADFLAVEFGLMASPMNHYYAIVGK